VNIIDQIADERDKAQQENKQLKARIKRLEEQLMEAKNKHAVLVADVVLRDDKIERIAHLEAALRRIANQDYRGNRSTESQIAFEALKP
jgi:cell division septum initiation protein DivIVA